MTEVGEVVGSPGFSDTNYRGKWFVSGGFFGADETTKDGQQVWQLFLGRFTHTGDPSGRLGVAVAPGTSEVNFATIVTPDEFNGGQGWITHDINWTPLFATLTSDDVFAFVRKDFQVEIEGVTYTVSDIYIQSLTPVPSPGGVAMCALAGAACVVRRRRGVR